MVPAKAALIRITHEDGLSQLPGTARQQVNTSTAITEHPIMPRRREGPRLTPATSEIKKTIIAREITDCGPDISGPASISCG
jgi:hypothetical protein